MFAESDHSLSIARGEIDCCAVVLDHGVPIVHVNHTVCMGLRRDDPLMLVAERRQSVQRTEDNTALHEALITAWHVPPGAAGPGRRADQHCCGAAPVSRRRCPPHRADAGQARHLRAAIGAILRSKPPTDAGRNAGAGMSVQQRSLERNRPHPGSAAVRRAHTHQRRPQQDRHTRLTGPAANAGGVAADGAGDTVVRCGSIAWTS